MRAAAFGAVGGGVHRHHRLHDQIVELQRLDQVGRGTGATGRLTEPRQGMAERPAEQQAEGQTAPRDPGGRRARVTRAPASASALAHRDADAALPGHLDGSLMAGVGMAHDAVPGSARQDAVRATDAASCVLSATITMPACWDTRFQLRSRGGCSPSSRPRRCPPGVEERPVSNHVRAVAHGLRLAVGVATEPAVQWSRR